jgi:hypothetical protein
VSGHQWRRRATRLSPSEIMTIVILFQQPDYRTFKAIYTEKVPGHLRDEFPHLVSYQRFIELPPRVLVPLIVYLRTRLGAFPMSASSASSASPATSAERSKWPSNEAIT